MQTSLPTVSEGVEIAAKTGYSLTSLSPVAEIALLHSKLCKLRPRQMKDTLPALLNFYQLLWSVDLQLLATQAYQGAGLAKAEVLCTFVTNIRAQTYRRAANGEVHGPVDLVDLDPLLYEYKLLFPLSYYLQLPAGHPEYATMERTIYTYLEQHRTLLVDCLEAWF